MGTRCHLTTDPRRTIVVGASYGQLAAAYAALQHPDVWGNVVAQSGAFYWRQGQDRAPDNGEDTDWNWLIRRYVTAPTLPVRFHLDVACTKPIWSRGGKHQHAEHQPPHA